MKIEAFRVKQITTNSESNEIAVKLQQKLCNNQYTIKPNIMPFHDIINNNYVKKAMNLCHKQKQSYMVNFVA